MSELNTYIRAAYAQEFETDEQSPVEDLVRHAFVTLAERSKALRAENARADKATAERDRLAALLRSMVESVDILLRPEWPDMMRKVVKGAMVCPPHGSCLEEARKALADIGGGK